MTQHPWEAWFKASKEPAFHNDLGSLYADLSKEIAAGGAVCQASGKCCKFNTYDHLLYATALEAAWLVHQDAQQHFKSQSEYQQQMKQITLPVASPRSLPDGCVFHVDGLCSAHLARPLGCRVFFCQQGTEDWQHTIYETYLQRLKTLHETYNVPYLYAEWRQLLASAQAYPQAGMI